MADSQITHPDFGTREEDWPDIDIDSDTEEGAAAIKLAEAAMHASMERSLKKRREQNACFTGDPDDGIPTALYDKARDHQDQLTQEERSVLLSRNDLIGQALARPDSLTTEEVHEVLCWPLPDVVRDNLQRATSGAISTPAELYAKCRDALERGQFDTMVNDDEVWMLTNGFRTKGDDSWMGEFMSYFHSPGFRHAHRLLSNRAGWSGPVWQAAALRRSPPRLLHPPAAPIYAPVSFADRYGGPWPTIGPSGQFSGSPLSNFMHDKKVGGFDVHPGWSALPEHQKEAYRAQSEAQRLASWAWYENAMAENPTRSWPHPEERQRHRIPCLRHIAVSEIGGDTAKHMTGLGMFGEEQGMGLGREDFQELLKKWDALTEQQRNDYGARATATNMANQAEERQRLQEARQTHVPELEGDGGILAEFPSRAEYVTGLRIFRRELGMGNGREEFQEVLAKWNALTEQQKKAYDERATATNKINEAEYRQRHLAWVADMRAGKRPARPLVRRYEEVARQRDERARQRANKGS